MLEDYKKGFNPDLAVLFTKHVLNGSVFDHVHGHAGADALALPLYVRTDAGDKIDRFTEMKGTRYIFFIELML